MRETKLTLETVRGTDLLMVRIIDEVSRTMIASFSLTPEDAWQFLGGAVVHVDGELTEHFERVGKEMEVDIIIYSHESLRASTYDQQIDDSVERARTDRPGWDAYSAHRRGGGSGGVQVTMRRWR